MAAKYGDEVGKTFPQSQDVISDLHYDSLNHLRNVWGKFPDDVYIPDSILHSKARFTDLISSSPIFYHILSEKLKKIIEANRKKGLEFHPTYVIQKQNKVPYWIMNGYEHDYQYIDFDLSLINVVGIGGIVLDQLHLKTKEGFEMAKESIKSPHSIWISKLVLKSGIKDNLIIIDKSPGGMFYFSEKLKSIIEDAGCTGIKFESIESAQ